MWIELASAIGSIGAVVVALCLGLKAASRDKRAQRELAERDKRKHAEATAFWYTDNLDEDTGSSDPELVFMNFGKSPVLNVKITYMLQRDMRSDPTRGSDMRELVLPNGTERVLIRDNHFQARVIGPFTCTFQDVAGRTWHRDAEGELTEVRCDNESDTGYGMH